MIIIHHSECGAFEPEAGFFRQAAHQVHILHCLSGCSLEQIIQDGMDDNLTFRFFQEDQHLIGIDHLLDIHHPVAHMGEGMSGIIFPVKVPGLLQGKVGLQIGADKDATCKTTPPGDEIQGLPETRLQGFQDHPDLAQVLVGQGLVGIDITGSPMKLGGIQHSAARTGGSGNTGGMDFFQQAPEGKGKKPEQDRSGKTSGIRYMSGVTDPVPLPFR